jgi:transposase-like protein/IS1 family transposase
VRLFACNALILIQIQFFTNNYHLLYFINMMSQTKDAPTMTCEDCKVECQRFGKHRNGLRRFRCPKCKRTFTEAHTKTLGAMNIPWDKALLAVQLLLEGNSIRSTERISGLDKNTIMRVLVLAGEKCEKVSDELIRNVPVKDVEADEIWSFIGKKEKRVKADDDPTFGDAYCFVGIERTTKLVLAWHLGRRTARDTGAFIEKVNEATAGEFQITTDGFRPYREAVSYSLGTRVDFAQLIKVYSASTEGEHRYSPADVVSTEVVPVIGRPDPDKICTSHVERQNLTMRMQIRRFTRLTNAFSKKWENHYAALSLYFAYYNFVRIHSTLRVTPAMETGLTDHVWSLRELFCKE